MRNLIAHCFVKVMFTTLEPSQGTPCPARALDHLTLKFGSSDPHVALEFLNILTEIELLQYLVSSRIENSYRGERLSTHVYTNHILAKNNWKLFLNADEYTIATEPEVRKPPALFYVLLKSPPRAILFHRQGDSSIESNGEDRVVSFGKL